MIIDIGCCSIHKTKLLPFKWELGMLRARYKLTCEAPFTHRSQTYKKPCQTNNSKGKKVNELG